jgi:hypothetical protein
MAYERPSVEDLGTLRDLTELTLKDFTGADGVVLQPSGVPLGPVS